MIQLHFYPSTAAMVPHILLEERGAPCERVSPARERPCLGPYLQRMLARPALQRVMTKRGLSPACV